MGRTVTSLTNPTVKAVRALHLGKERESTGLFLAEGLKTVVEGVDTGQAPKVLMHAADADHPLLARAAAATQRRRASRNRSSRGDSWGWTRISSMVAMGVGSHACRTSVRSSRALSRRATSAWCGAT